MRYKSQALGRSCLGLIENSTFEFLELSLVQGLDDLVTEMSSWDVMGGGNLSCFYSSNFSFQDFSV